MRLLSDLAPYPDLSGHGEYTARDYVQDGLIAMWDGIENAGWGMHDATATSWVDLIGGHNVDFSRSDSMQVKWDGMSLMCEGKTYGYGSYNTNGIVTIEIVESHAGRSTCVICQFNSSRQVGFGGSEYELSFSQAPNNASISTGVSDDKEYSRSVSVEYGSDNELTRAHINGQSAALLPRKSNFGYYGRQRIGAVAATTYNFIGRIMSIRLYSRALTPAEVAANYEVDKARFHIGEEPLAGKRLMGVGAKEAAPLKAEFPSSVGSRARGLLALKAINWAAAKGEDMKTVTFTETKLAIWNNIKAQVEAEVPPGSIIWRKTPNDEMDALVCAVRQSNGTWGTNILRKEANVVSATVNGQYVQVNAGDEFYVFPIPF